MMEARGIKCLGAGVTGSCEPPEKDAENQTENILATSDFIFYGPTRQH